MTLISYVKNAWDLASQGDLEGIWFWMGVYALLACSYSVLYQIRVRRWPRTTGSLHHAKVSMFGAAENDPSERKYHADARYTYGIESQTYTGRRVSPWILLTNVRALLRHQLKGIETSPNEEVTVFYNPNAPQKSYLVLPSKRGIIFTFLLGTLPGIGYLCRYHF